jgi:hypothetical protein
MVKPFLAALAVAGAALVTAPNASAAPTSPVAPSIAPGGFVSIGVSGGGRHAPRPVWGVTGYRLESRSVLVGYDAWRRPVYTVQTFSVPVYGWIYPAYAPRAYARPRVSLGLGVGFRL